MDLIDFLLVDFCLLLAVCLKQVVVKSQGTSIRTRDLLYVLGLIVVIELLYWKIHSKDLKGNRMKVWICFSWSLCWFG